ncbi:ankyrin repeat domain-containing protein [Alkalilimnicola ehrlichii]|uniref:ankyrin repeat domain-containing protein n=1 Tax=Alkalilimnicola ehrlichii TaxID=351052 RepID=UPI0015F26825
MEGETHALERLRALRDANLLEHDVGALAHATKKNDIEVLAFLLDSGFDPNSAGETEKPYSNSPLLLAVRNDDWDKVRLLLKYGADSTVENWQGQSALGILRNQQNVPEDLRP